MQLHRALRASIAVVLSACIDPATRAAEPSSLTVHRLQLRVVEAAGIQRFGYPVSATLALDPPAGDARRMRLLHDGKPVRAQFRLPADSTPPHKHILLDFADSYVANESRTYIVEYGPGVPAHEQDEPKRVILEDNTVVVRMSEHIGWVWSRRHLGVLRSVKTRTHEYMSAGSRGLILNGTHRLGDAPVRPPQIRILKDGPFAAAFRVKSQDRIGDNRIIESTIDFEFARTKSWARIDWAVNDPDNAVRALALDLNYNIEGKPTRIDFGSHSYTYLTISDAQSAQMRYVGAPPLAGPWVLSEVWRKRGEKRELYFGGRLEPPTAARPEGWMHLMDDQRCIAAALAEFGRRPTEDRIDVTASGRLTLSRRFTLPPCDGVRRVTFWQHLVPMPMHVGAATSPQSMLAPMQVVQSPHEPNTR